jgi:hypothetical protein
MEMNNVHAPDPAEDLREDPASNFLLNNEGVPDEMTGFNRLFSIKF